MKNKTNIVFIIITFLFSLLLSFSIELFYFNRNVIAINNSDNLKVIETSGFKEKNGEYVSTSDKSYIIAKYNKNYISKLDFNYVAKNNFTWNIEYKNKNGESKKIYQSSSLYIHKATRVVNDNTNLIKLTFDSKGISLKKFVINNNIYLNYSRILFFLFLIFIPIILFKFKIYFSKRLENAFLLIAIVSGLLMMFTISKTVFLSWDDQIHLSSSHSLFDNKETKYSNAFQLLESENCTYFQTREEKIRFYNYLNKIHSRTKNRVVQLNDYSFKYNKIVYLPFWIGFQIANFFNFSFIFGLLFAKILNFICYILLMFYAIKISTYAKKVIFVFSLLISNIFLAINFSYDSMIIASITLGLASFFKILEMKRIDYKYVFIFIICIVWSSLPKAIYSPLLLLLLFIPNDKFKSKNQAIKLKLTTLFITLVLMSLFVLPALSGGLGGGDSRGGNTDATAQLAFIKNNPVLYCKTLIKFLISDGSKLFIGPFTLASAGYVINVADDYVSLPYLISLILILYYTFTVPVNKKIINNKMKTVFAVCYGGIWLLITTALYLDFTEVGKTIIAGVQPRYFIPILLLLLMMLKPTTKKEINIDQENKCDFVLLSIPYFLLMFEIFTILVRTVAI